MVTTTRGLAAVGAICLAGGVLVSCAEKKLDHMHMDRINLSILNSAEKLHVDPGVSHVNCPDDVDAKSGTTFECGVARFGGVDGK